MGDGQQRRAMAVGLNIECPLGRHVKHFMQISPLILLITLHGKDYYPR